MTVLLVVAGLALVVGCCAAVAAAATAAMLGLARLERATVAAEPRRPSGGAVPSRRQPYRQ